MGFFLVYAFCKRKKLKIQHRVFLLNFYTCAYYYILSQNTFYCMQYSQTLRGKFNKYKQKILFTHKLELPCLQILPKLCNESYLFQLQYTNLESSLDNLCLLNPRRFPNFHFIILFSALCDILSPFNSWVRRQDYSGRHLKVRFPHTHLLLVIQCLEKFRSIIIDRNPLLESYHTITPQGAPSFLCGETEDRQTDLQMRDRQIFSQKSTIRTFYKCPSILTCFRFSQN